MQENFRRWLSVPDPWINHNVARKAYHRSTATWFMQGNIFKEWKSTGSLLWIHGLRTRLFFVSFATADIFRVLAGSGKSILWCVLQRPYLARCTHVIDSSTVIEDVQDMCQTGLATLVIFYFDFRDAAKQDARSLMSSLLVQLSNQSNSFSATLSEFFSTHDQGSRQPSEDALTECLKDMLQIPGQGAIYIIVDALDECPNSYGYPTPREQVLVIIQDLINLHLPHVHFCLTSRPEVDIREVLKPLTMYNVSLHEERGQNQDIIDYIKTVVSSDPKMRRWQEEDRQLVIRTLTEKAGGM